MKILFFSDLHLRSQSDIPRWRIDNHYETQFNEFNEIIELTKIHDVDLLISGGDTIHHPDVSHGLIADVIKACSSLKVPFYSVVGNHCTYGFRTDDLKSSGLGVLFQSGVIKRLDDISFDNHKVAIRGVHAFIDPRKGDYTFEEKYDDYYKLVVSHNFIIPHVVPFDAVLPKDVKTNATLIALGHYHQSFDVKEGNTRFINPGSVSRWAVNEQHEPQVLLIDTDLNSIQQIKLKSSLPASQIFDLGAVADLKAEELNLQKFVDSLESRQFESLDIENVVVSEGTKQNLASVILDTALEKIQAAKEVLK